MWNWVPPVPVLFLHEAQTSCHGLDAQKIFKSAAQKGLWTLQTYARPASHFGLHSSGLKAQPAAEPQRAAFALRRLQIHQQWRVG